MAGDAAQTRKHFPRKIKIVLIKDRFLVVIGMARERAQAVFEYKLET